MTALGLFKDSDTLRHDNFKENLNRLFKTEVFSPFSANIAFVLHKCDTPKTEDLYSQYKVSFLLNELPIGEINAGQLVCALNSQIDSSICEFNHLKSQMNDFLNDDLESSCNSSTVGLKTSKNEL